MPIVLLFVIRGIEPSPSATTLQTSFSYLCKQLFCQCQEGKGEGFDHSNIFQYEESDRGIHYSACIKERIRVRIRVRMKASV